MLGLILAGLGVVIAIVGVRGIAKQQITLSQGKDLEGQTAVVVGTIALLIGVFTAFFGLIGLPLLMNSL